MARMTGGALRCAVVLSAVATAAAGAAFGASPNVGPAADAFRAAPGPLADPDASWTLGPVWGVGDESLDAAGDTARRSVPRWLSQRHQQILANIARVPEGPRPELCFAPGTDDTVIEAFRTAMEGVGTRFQPTSRWTSTATDGGGLATHGAPVTLTWSIVPDGTVVPNRAGFAGNSNLRAYLNGIYGSEAVWRPLFEQVFARWSEVCGVHYVYEPNDDGSQLNTAAGQIGVRGDIRLAVTYLDGPGNVLAYNVFPDDGDMVLDTGDNFFQTTTNNSLRLRNVVAHEHGHGIGLLHECPILQQRLMEPFVSELFDGPQHDDIRGAQRLYGDPFEPDDTPAQATDLGTLSSTTMNPGALSAPPVANGSALSIDAAGEQDWFRFETTGPESLSVSITPLGMNYDDSAQACGGAVGSCCSGNFINSLSLMDLNLRVTAADGTTVIASADATGAGSGESLSGVILHDAGTYYVRVAAASGADQTQLYSISISATPFGYVPLSMTLVDPAPQTLTPGAPTQLTVQITPNGESIVGGSALVHWRVDGGAFATSPLAPIGGDLYTATLPGADCGQTVDFYFSVSGDQSGQTTLPQSAPAGLFSAVAGQIGAPFADNFETDTGWTVTNVLFGTGAFAGAWQRGVPAGDGTRGDPTSDYDGSGQCYLTGNGAGNTDVDGGETILTSPSIDLTGLGDVEVSYARWYSNTQGSAPESDVFTVEVSDNDGGNWHTLEVVGPTRTSPNPEVDGGWFYKTLPIAGIINVTRAFRIRFIASDADPGSVIEAAVDAVSVRGVACAAAVCPCETDGDAAQVNVFDLLAYLADWFPQNGMSGAGLSADFNNSGNVDVFDLLDFLSCWFPASAGNPCP